MENTLRDILWIDDFILRIKPYVFVRKEDNILIKRPNKATKLNQTGTMILDFLIKGNTVKSLVKKVGEEKIKEINDFMVGVYQFLKEDFDKIKCNPAVEETEFKKSFSELPVLSELALTYKCNLKCNFCYAGCNETPHNEYDELGLKEYKMLIEKLYCQAKVPSISFTGGEPTLVTFLPELIKFAKKLGMRVNLITNGTQINEKYARLLKKSGLDSAQISLEGITPEKHDAIVSKKGAFDAAIGAIQHLKSLQIHTHCNTTITKKNLEDCLQMPKFVNEVLKNDKFSMNLVIPTGNTLLNDEIIVKYSEIPPVIEQIIKESEKYEVEFMWYSPLPMCFFNSVAKGLGNKGCSTCDGLISIAPDGSVLPCASYIEPVGNLLLSDFEEIWHTKKAKMFRNKELAHDLCKKCEDYSICHGACPLYWQQMHYSELFEVEKTKTVTL